MTMRTELIDELLKGHTSPQDSLGEGKLLKQLTKAVVERCSINALMIRITYTIVPSIFFALLVGSGASFAQSEVIFDDELIIHTKPIQILNQSRSIAQVNNEPETLSYIALKFSRLGENKIASQLFGQATSLFKTKFEDYKESTAAIASNLALAGKSQEMLKLSRKLRSNIAKVEILSQTAVVIASKGKITHAKSLLSEALDLTKSLPYGEGNASCYDEHSYGLTLVIKGLVATGQIQEALRTAIQVENCISASQDYFIDYQLQAFKSIVEGSKSTARLNAILQKAKLLRNGFDGKFGTRNWVLGIISIRFLELGEIKKSLQVVNLIDPLAKIEADEEAKNSGYVLNNPLEKAQRAKFETFLEIAALLMEQGKDKEASQLASQIPEENNPDKDLALIIKANQLLKSKNEPQANVLFSQILTSKEIRSVRSMIALIRIGKTDLALNAIKSSFFYEDKTEIIKELLKMKKFASALKLVDSIYQSNPNEKAKAMALIAGQLYDFRLSLAQ